MKKLKDIFPKTLKKTKLTKSQKKFLCEKLQYLKEGCQKSGLDLKESMSELRNISANIAKHYLQKPKRGRFIVLEGVDGSGKTTQAELLAKELGAIHTREPYYGNIFGQAILETKDEEIRQYLMLANRLKHYSDLIDPALKKGQDVICTRWVWSSWAYGGYLGASKQVLMECESNSPRPDYVFFINTPIDIGLSRVAERGEIDPTFENHDCLSYVFNEYVRLAGFSPDNSCTDHAVIIDGEQSRNEICNDILSNLE